MKVAVIGAGVAGLCCARELLCRGVEVDVFEKSRGLGGRLANKRLHWGQFDLGAQYFTARDQRFQQQVSIWEDQGIVQRWAFTPSVLTADTLQPSPDKILRYVGSPKMNSIAHALAEGLKVVCQTRVTGVTGSAKEGWTICLENKDRHPGYDWVVLTVPGEQCIPLIAEKTVLAEKIPAYIHRPCWSLALATRGVVASHIQGIFGDESVTWVSRLSSRPASPKSAEYDDLWMLHFSPEWSAMNEQLLPETVASLGIEWLQNTLRVTLSCEHWYPHYWRYASIKSNIESPSVLVDPEQHLAIAGAWCCQGRVEGAYLSGLDVVDRLISS